MGSELFKTGSEMMTAGIGELVRTGYGREIQACMRRHKRGDWGDLSEEDKQVNEDALKNGERLLSAYDLSNGAHIYIITEWDRSVTTVLLASEY